MARREEFAFSPKLILREERESYRPDNSFLTRAIFITMKHNKTRQHVSPNVLRLTKPSWRMANPRPFIQLNSESASLTTSSKL